MRNRVVIGILVALAGCAVSESRLSNQAIELPDAAVLPCCWQSQEQLEIQFGDDHLVLNSVIAVSDGNLTVVLLDPLGRQLMTIRQVGREVRIEKNFQEMVELPVTRLLLGIFLRYMPDEGWRNLGAEWELRRHQRDANLFLAGVQVVALTELTEKVVMLNYPQLKLEIRLTNVSRLAL